MTPLVLRMMAALLILAAGARAQSFIATPLSCLGTGTYLGFEGGLYENGSNDVPADHSADALTLVAEIGPINGQTVMPSIGMSNAKDEFGAFVKQANTNPQVNDTNLVLINGAYPSAVACYWTFASGSAPSLALRSLG